MKIGNTIRIAAMLALTTASFAQLGGNIPSSSDVQSNTRPSVLTQVGIDQHLGEQIPLNLAFKDEHGKDVLLGSYFNQKRPVILALVYYDCPMLCTQVLNGMTSALGVLKFSAGKEFDVVAVSFDPRETPELAAAKKKTYIDRYRRPGAEQGIHFLTGSQESITALTKAVGFRYVWDDKTQQFAHASALMLATPDGRLAQYYYGIEYSPKDMRLGMIEASEEKIGNVTDQLILFCYHYDPMTGKYGAIAMNFVRAGGALTVLILLTFMIVSIRREHHGPDGHTA
jgi:protein SCO1/2